MAPPKARRYTVSLEHRSEGEEGEEKEGEEEEGEEEEGEEASSRNSTVHTLPTELLEFVLLMLDMEDILRSIRVCWRWKKVIMTSSELQVSLFIQPLKSSKEAPDSQPNPLLYKVFPALLEWGDGSEKTVNEIIDELPWSKDEQWSEAIARPTASWRKMYTEKPSKHHVFELENQCGRRDIKQLRQEYGYVVLCNCSETLLAGR